MKKLFKILTVLGISSVFLLGCAVCGCADDGTDTPQIPEILYTTDDVLIGQFDANDERFAPESVTMRDRKSVV